MTQTEALDIITKLQLAHQAMEAACTRVDQLKAENKALKEALAQPEQEPVAWMWRCKPYCNWPEWSVSLKRPADSGRDGHKPTEGYEDMPLYTSPPAQRTWVGLTDEDWSEISDMPDTFDQGVAWAQARLKEKNA